jgi:hypothetical protein
MTVRRGVHRFGAQASPMMISEHIALKHSLYADEGAKSFT